MNIYYVYRYIRLDTNVPFYIGKGKNNRAYTTKNRNPYFTNIIKFAPYKVEIIMSGLSEEEAYAKEIYFISLYKSYGMCVANITSGGDGCPGLSPETIERRRQVWVGRKHTEESKSKMREAKLGKKRKPHSEETKQKMRNSLHTKNPERNRKISEAKKGKMSLENKEKLSKMMKERVRTPEMIQKHKDSMKKRRELKQKRQKQLEIKALHYLKKYEESKKR